MYMFSKFQIVENFGILLYVTNQINVNKKGIRIKGIFQVNQETSKRAL